MNLFSSEWTRKLMAELEDLLRLDSMEWWVACHEVENISLEKAALSDQTRMKRMLMDSTQMSALLLQNEVASAEALAADAALVENEDAAMRMCSTESGMLGSPIPTVGLEGADLLQKKVRIQVYNEVAAKHEAAYNALSSELERKVRATVDAGKREEYFKKHHQKLGQQFTELKKGGTPALLHPHPMLYESEVGDACLSALKITTCELYRYDFEFNDIIVASCRHLYHPWCAGTHFNDSNLCADDECGQIMTPDWSKCFGFKDSTLKWYRWRTRQSTPFVDSGFWRSTRR
jgi:hypothetical protein